MGKKKLRQSKEVTTLDPKTGEYVPMTTEKVFTEVIEDSDKFFMTYIDFISPWFNLKPETAKNVLMWMLQNAQFDTGDVYLPTTRRKEICEALKIQPQTLTNCLSSLKKSRLISGEQGVFKINPQIFWKGSKSERDKMLKNKQVRISFGLAPLDTEYENDQNKDIDEFGNPDFS